ncbi:amidohydrolase family protein [Allokutzneria albata]|uniref:Imidazolonepropionase n=1 Tax=Allokutzneria albata TaxID=211114 RepID=A0A1G9RZ06_ALLAB|nr:amidohydrolase family protein [Allokutzneria albata]SDM28267.1 Imidazolonepropionase [Allokutzneria albata]
MATRLDEDVVLVRGAALADGRSAELRRGVSLLVEHGVVAGVWDTGDEPPHRGRVIDASGATIIPGMVDSHSHLSMPGGAQWVQRGFDSTEELLAVAEENGDLMVRAGIRWARDVGAPRRPDPVTGGERALSLRLRDAWRGRADRPYIRAAGTWLGKSGALPHGLAVEVEHGADLLAAARVQLDDGADLVKLYLDGPDRDTPPFTVEEVTAVVREAHARGARVAAHSGMLHGSQVGAAAGVDSIEHGFQLDRDAASAMAKAGTVLVSTLGVMHSWLTFTDTSTVDRFTAPDSRATIGARLEAAEEGVRLAHAAGVPIAAGSDFGGGSLRANQLAWEAEALVRAGIPPHEALAALTWRGGDLLGDPTAGRLEVGGPAHFSLVHGDPLSDPASLWRVWLTR